MALRSLWEFCLWQTCDECCCLSEEMGNWQLYDHIMFVDRCDGSRVILYKMWSSPRCRDHWQKSCSTYGEPVVSLPAIYEHRNDFIETWCMSRRKHTNALVKTGHIWRRAFFSCWATTTTTGVGLHFASKQQLIIERLAKSFLDHHVAKALLSTTKGNMLHLAFSKPLCFNNPHPWQHRVKGLEHVGERCSIRQGPILVSLTGAVFSLGLFQLRTTYYSCPSRRKHHTTESQRQNSFSVLFRRKKVVSKERKQEEGSLERTKIACKAKENSLM